MKENLDIKTIKLQSKLHALRVDRTDINILLDLGLKNRLKLDYAFSLADTEQQWLIIKTMFPENLTIEGRILRTARVNEAAHLICLINNNLPPNKNGQIIKKRRFVQISDNN